MKRQRVVFLWLLFAVLVIPGGPPPHVEAKVYVDITSPGVSKLPIAVQSFVGGREISDIVSDDLTFTGLFRCIEDAAQIERPEQPFNAANWKGLGVELVVKGKVEAPFKVVVSAYDVGEAKEILRKEYTASRDLLRPVAHTVANDIYQILTGRNGVFKTRIAYVADKDGRRGLSLMDWDGHRARGVGITAGILLTPHWSWDGAKLLYAAERNREWGIYQLDLNPMKERNVVMLTGLSMAGNYFPDNREFVFTSSKDGKPDIYIGDTVSMTGRRIISSPWIDVSPTVSPDGNYVAFVSDRSGNPQVYLAGKDGSGVRRLTHEGSYNTAPAWSPRGDRIAYVSRTGGKHQIFLVKPDGSGVTQLTERGNNEEPVFSPDGKYIAFTSDRDGAKGIYLMRADGEGQKRITPKGLKATSPSWSPQ